MAGAEPVITVRPVQDFATLERDWIELEGRAEASFFQSWAWTGCLVAERFPDPWLLEARRHGRVVALGLFNRTPGRWLRPASIALGETGAGPADSIFIEHNGLLIDRTERALDRFCWQALADSALGRLRWVLSGLPTETASTLRDLRRLRVTARRPAPFLDFGRLPTNVEVTDTLSANLRQQLRRAQRGWERFGPLGIERAAGPVEAERFLTALADLHQATWRARGKPGAFAEPFFGRFHRTLLERAGPDQSLDVLRITAGDRVIGYLYNLVHRGWVAAYQSGFAYGPDTDRLHPGLVCHLLAIEHYRRAGMRLYDFLAGDARYKRSFANAARELVWLEARPGFPGFKSGRMTPSPGPDRGISP